MSEYTEQLANILRRLEAVEQAQAGTDRSLHGGMGPSDMVSTIEDRLTVLEVSNAALLYTSEASSESSTAAESDDGELITDIEYGLVKTAPTSTELPTIILRPCDKDGVEYASADDVTVYVCRDRAEVDQSVFDWTTATVLTWLRFVSEVTDPITAELVAGVLVGGQDAYEGDGAPDSGGQFTAHYIGSASTPEVVDIPYTLDGCLNSLLFIGLDVRVCDTLNHPGDKTTLPSGGVATVAFGNPIATWSGDSTNWISLSYSAVSSAGVSLGHGVSAIPELDIQVQVGTDGILKLQLYNSAVLQQWEVVIMGAIWRKKCDVPPGTAFGAGS